LRRTGTDGFAERVHQEDAENPAGRVGFGPRTAKGDRIMNDNPHIGSTLDDFLREEGMFEDATNYAIKRVLAWQVEKAMHDQGITKVEMARRMGTSRAHLNRLLDPGNDKVQLDTVQRAAAAIGRKVRMELV
jgi:predicted XRE-type DNA-binding protein